ncbi:hypothetical protein ACFQJ7_16725 [Halovenus rubra]|uniref:Protein kinase domain-containing protein n=2 Tax=Halovenus rubra TaxID=869890 RepID=A0ABD5X8W9_9EURY|nr:hypothetical protein [Halovenus rubra]
MERPTPTQSPTTPDVPQQPPLQIVKQGGVWVVETYRRGDGDGRVFSTHDTQIDAVRAAKSKMEAGTHPCTLRWETANSVSNLYWNPLFERLVVQYDELLDAWTAVPEQGTSAMCIEGSKQAICDKAKRVQRAYDFKHLRVCEATSHDFEERDHRFLRHDITASGVRFDPSKLNEQAMSVDEDDEHDDEQASDDNYVTPASPGQLGASIPDVTKVQFIDTDGCLHRYKTPWGDGTTAEILTVSRKYADDDSVRDAFELWLSRWRTVNSQPTVATIYETGTEPVPWVAYQTSDQTLESVGTDLPITRRLSVLSQLGSVVKTVSEDIAAPVCGIHPARLYLHNSGRDERVTVSQLGIEWEVQRATGTHQPTPFTAPEQISGQLTSTTGVYQVGAVAYWLLCESLPITADHNIAGAITRGDIPSPRPVTDVPSDVVPIINDALATDPSDRYDSTELFSKDLLRVL